MITTNSTQRPLPLPFFPPPFSGFLNFSVCNNKHFSQINIPNPFFHAKMIPSLMRAAYTHVVHSIDPCLLQFANHHQLSPADDTEVVKKEGWSHLLSARELELEYRTSHGGQ